MIPVMMGFEGILMDVFSKWNLRSLAVRHVCQIVWKHVSTWVKYDSWKADNELTRSLTCIPLQNTKQLEWLFTGGVVNIQQPYHWELWET